MFVNFKDSPYWKTLDPIISSGAMQAAIDGVYRYPYRINLYPGTSCMFKCVFCGRNYNATADRSDNIFSKIIQDDDGKDKDRINITGGLEPLTSPHINTICKDLHDKGYRSRMITNGFLLNEKTLTKNPYINSLHHLRISLYGLDEDETRSTTKHSKAWTVVRDNLKAYNKRQDRTGLYLNYVLLPDHFENLQKILEYIEHIGGVENLSLREDFSFQYPIIDRIKIKDRLLQFDERVKKMNIKVDYGYALTDAMNGITRPLMTVSHTEVASTQSPQVKICVDPEGNIFSHMQAGFIKRPGALRHRLGNVVGSSIEKELSSVKEIKPEAGDEKFIDAFNSLIYKYIYEERKQNIL
jgi:dTDP-4-amino-4,6-dideoxy-D-glucose ammonia-lyase